MKSLTIFLPIVLLIFIDVVSSQGLVTFQRNAERLQAKNNLGFDARCSFAGEEKRTAFGLKMLDAMKSGNPSGILNMNSDLEKLLKEDNFCDSRQNMQCQSNGKCGCANGDLGYGSVQSVRENSACRLRRNSLCMPQEALASLGANAPDLRCQARTSCIYREDRSACSLQKIITKVQGSFGTRRPSMAELMSRLQTELQNGICQCG